ncbi:MAG: Hsp20/alpha crystallin family protein [Deltaproteobacteria bacterium]|nr:Hsp20/alpha crystallin family protein [Deltaproteobacteria bacterium]
MERNKLAPWNWFRTEETDLPVEGSYADPISRMHREMDRMFEELLQSFGVLAPRREGPARGMVGVFRPSLDVAATDKEYTVSVELPGVDKDDVSVEVENDTLRIWGQKQQKEEKKEQDYYRVERAYGCFQRVLSLPEDADADNIQASFKNGVMKISIPRKQTVEGKSRQIEVQAA